INKYFGEIKSHGTVPQRTAMVPTLEKSVRLFHEDNFANVPELTMVWPAAQSYQKDAYALDFLARILSEGKKAPMYKVLVKEKQLTSNATAYNNSEELAGEFTISIRANDGKNLKEIEAAVFEAFDRFEKEGFTDKDVERVKASMENSFYNSITSVSGKSMQLAYYNTLMNDPGYIVKDIENIKAVTKEEIKAVYEKYVKGKPYVMTSFVPKGKTDLMAENSQPAGVKEEDITKATQMEIADYASQEIQKTPSAIDRTKEPAAGADPAVKVPAIWKASLANGIQVFGIENKELPVVQTRITIDGGFKQDNLNLPGVANLVANVLPQGTVNKTPEELEEEIQLLGSTINVSLGSEEMNVQASSLSRNFSKTAELITEILLQPRWDSTEFVIAQTRNRNRIIQSEAQPRSVASLLFNKLMYGPQNILSNRTAGTRESIDKITVNDLKAFYANNFSPSVTRIHIAGNISKEEALKAFEKLGTEWKAKEVTFNDYPVPPVPEKSQIYFYDMPGSGQSVISIGYLAMARNNPDYPKADFVNYRLGGNFSSILNQILREQKGFTYGASSYFQEMKSPAPFVASSMVRSDATLESITIFKNEMDKYRQGVSEEDLQFIKNSMIRSNALRFETNSSLVDMISTMTKYGFPDDYIKKEEDVVRSMTVEQHKEIAQKYINPDRMYYVIVGDAATQLKPLEKAGLGKPVLVTAKTIDTVNQQLIGGVTK
ncbi:MAG TPA: insulinase family protein, partial [Bacteroidales bacterium]|nr:insulinase family protein [Bacteroidales bacterium]